MLGEKGIISPLDNSKRDVKHGIRA